MDICLAYETDALVRRVNVDRYDDREIIRTNLIESYDQLMKFGRKHLSDKFFIEELERKIRRKFGEKSEKNRRKIGERSGRN